MESVYLLVPVSVVLVFGIAVAFWWSVRSGQFDDLEGPGFKVLMDDDERPVSSVAEEGDDKESKS
ncbi:MAG: cbb3-type cytochrome oxidase assembly protein CcoS [Azonexaceae bacterium]|uniref:cbb3-type cytochrome oxidase assembly protein CcoS n=1 Tax=Azonexus sp. R2A61 TaxID=2744443 RepID=UPI001F1FA79F|nr:cbb3-type cytochrome oxidase assembly protein CcoS [Azonexus sp. R2A61]MCE1239299.1 cbb3-type cytochrome oxidase assembly protein CcoS [Azonexaceae bacterium]